MPLALAAGVLLLIGLMALFRQPVPVLERIRPLLIQLRPLTTALPPVPRHRTRFARSTTGREASPAMSRVEAHTPVPISGITVPAPPPLVLLHEPSFYTDLGRALRTPVKPPLIQNGDSYRSVYGGAVFKAGGMCSEMRTVQIGPSPSNRATVAYPGSCPGEYRPDMSDEMLQWAQDYAHHHPPP